MVENDRVLNNLTCNQVRSSVARNSFVAPFQYKDLGEVDTTPLNDVMPYLGTKRYNLLPTDVTVAMNVHNPSLYLDGSGNTLCNVEVTVRNQENQVVGRVTVPAGNPLDGVDGVLTVNGLSLSVANGEYVPGAVGIVVDTNGLSSVNVSVRINEAN